MSSNTGTTSFPGSLDDFTNVALTTYEDDVGFGHGDLHNQVHEAVEAIEAKVGINSSAVTTSHAYKLSDITGTAKALAGTASFVTLSGTETLTNKTINNPVIGTPAVTGGTISTSNIHNPIIGTPAISAGTFSGGVLANNTIGTPAISGGTASGITLAGVTLTNPTINYTDTTMSMNVKCRAFLNQAQNDLTDNTPTKVLLNAETYDIGNDFDTTNSRFVAPVSGYYLIQGQVYFQNIVQNKRYLSLIYVNESQVSQAMTFSGLTTYCATQITDIQYVAAGQYIELYATAEAGANTVDLLTTAGITYLCIHLLSI